MADDILLEGPEGVVTEIALEDGPGLSDGVVHAASLSASDQTGRHAEYRKSVLACQRFFKAIIQESIVSLLKMSYHQTVVEGIKQSGIIVVGSRKDVARSRFRTH